MIPRPQFLKGILAVSFTCGTQYVLSNALVWAMVSWFLVYLRECHCAYAFLDVTEDPNAKWLEPL